MKSISFQIAKTALQLIVQTGKQGMVALVGITQADFDLLTGSAQWVPSDRNRVALAFNSLLHASADIIQAPRFRLPCEYTAAGIAMFVNPCNAQAICRILERNPSAVDLGANEDTAENVSAERLYSLVLQLYNDSASTAARAQFEAKTSLALTKILPETIE